VNIGYGPGPIVLPDNNFNGSPGASLDFSGLTVGGQIGYNISVGSGLVIGIEGDAN
jgi:hypothetical protein